MRWYKIVLTRGLCSQLQYEQNSQTHQPPWTCQVGYVETWPLRPFKYTFLHVYAPTPLGVMRLTGGLSPALNHKEAGPAGPAKKLVCPMQWHLGAVLSDHLAALTRPSLHFLRAL